MSKSYNGWSVIDYEGTRKWIIPGTERHIVMRKGAAGFCLAHLALLFHEKIEPLNGGEWDEWGWAVRQVRGSTRVSNHSSGTAMDLNATQHPLGVRNTFKKAWQAARIKFYLRTKYKGRIVWGGTWTRPDDMHFEVAASAAQMEGLAESLAWTERGKRIRKANP